MHLLPVQHALDFIMAGNAYFTVKNTRNGNFIHFHVIKGKNPKFPQHYVEVKKGAVVETAGGDKDGNWVYMGAIRNGVFQRTPKSRVDVVSVEFRAFDLILKKLQGYAQHPEYWDPAYIIYRHVWCGRCGRHLEDEVSVEDGLGAHCYKKIHGHARSTKGRRIRAAQTRPEDRTVAEEDLDGENPADFGINPSRITW